MLWFWIAARRRTSLGRLPWYTSSVLAGVYGHSSSGDQMSHASAPQYDDAILSCIAAMKERRR